jgi:drug/metabolite transporter (DMT)-like permease
MSGSTECASTTGASSESTSSGQNLEKPKIEQLPPVRPVSQAELAPGIARSRLLELAAFVGIYLIWGSTYLGIRVGVRTIPPLLLAGARSALAGAVVFLVLRIRGVRAPTLREWGHAAVAGVLLLSFGNGLVTWAEERVPSGLAALFVAATPLYMALIDALRPRGQRPSRGAAAGIALGLLGIGLLAAPDRSSLETVRLSDVVALLGAGLAWAAGSLYVRHAGRPEHRLMGAAQQMVMGGACLLVVGWMRGETAGFTLAVVDRAGAVAFAYLTVLGSIVAFSVYGWLLVESTPTRVSTIPYVTPVVAVILGWLILGETLNARTLVAGALIVLAVTLMTVYSAPSAGRSTRA